MITTIIFDWGGVFTQGRYTLAILNNLEKVSDIEKDEIYESFDKLIVQMMAGEFGFEEFVRLVNDSFNLCLSIDEMREVFRNSIVPNESMVEYARELSSKYRLAMLSDNDEVTVSNLRKYHSDLYNLFEKLYFSYQLKIRKPNPEIFKYALKDLDVRSEECIFVDDKEKNVKAARYCGINGVLYISINDLKESFEGIGIKV